MNGWNAFGVLAINYLGNTRGYGDRRIKYRIHLKAVLRIASNLRGSSLSQQLGDNDVCQRAHRQEPYVDEADFANH